ncbi:MAG TPA: MFS transporter [Solirubrobacterales bacterium]|nr:MFS transporter [Solirubrobacterales bacterium]
MLPQRYRDLFARPTVRTVVAGGFAGRLAFGFYSLVLILLVHQKTDSFAAAGIVTAAFSLGVGAAPLCARLIDRFGARVLLAVAAAHALASFAVFALLLEGAPVAPLIFFTWCAGLFLPPVGPVMRSIWRATIADPDLQTAAISFESVTMEVVWLIGPLLVAVATATGGLLALLALGPVLTVIGTVMIVVVAGHHLGAGEGARGADDRGGDKLGALRAPEVRLLVLVAIAIGLCLGGVEVSIAAFANARLGPAYAGVLLATLSLGGITCGLAYGARAQHRRLRTRYMHLLLLIGLLTVLLAATDWIPTTVLVLIAFGGCFAVTLVVANQLISEIALPGTITEAFTWQTGMLQMGVAGGTTIAGIAVEHGGGAGAGFGAAALAAFLAAGGAAYLVRRARAAVQAAPAPAPGAGGAKVCIDDGSPSSHQG